MFTILTYVVIYLVFTAEVGITTIPIFMARKPDKC